MYRLRLLAVVAAALLSITHITRSATVTIEDMGCVPGGAMFNYQNVYRIIIWNDNNVSYLEEVPCGSGRWYERGRVVSEPYTGGGGTLGLITPSGAVEFPAPPGRAGIITLGNGPSDRGFQWQPDSYRLVISAPLMQSILTKFN